MQDAKSRYVVSVLVADRVGIMRGITVAVADLDGDIEGISQTVVQGYFTVVLVAAFEHGVGEEEIRTAVSQSFKQDEISVLVREFISQPRSSPQGSRYILTLMGKEAPGILKQLTVYLADKLINIEDWFFRIEGDTVTHVGEITVPTELDIREVQDELRALLEPRELHVHCRHENLFRATNEVKPIGAMLNGLAPEP